MNTAPRLRTHREQLADDAFTRATKDSVITAQIRRDREIDEFEAVTGRKVDRLTGCILHERTTR